MGNIATNSKMMSWSITPINDRLDYMSWSEEGKIRIYSDKKYDEVVAYILYYDTSEKMTYLKDIRNNVLYAIPSGSKAKGYTLAFKLNLVHKEE